MKSKEFDQAEIIKNLRIDAKGVGIPEGAAEIFVDRAVKSATKALKSKSIITESDWDRAIIKELRKYNADFAYVYENRDKIV